MQGGSAKRAGPGIRIHLAVLVEIDVVMSTATEKAVESAFASYGPGDGEKSIAEVLVKDLVNKLWRFVPVRKSLSLVAEALNELLPKEFRQKTEVVRAAS